MATEPPPHAAMHDGTDGQAIEALHQLVVRLRAQLPHAFRAEVDSSVVVFCSRHASALVVTSKQVHCGWVKDFERQKKHDALAREVSPIHVVAEHEITLVGFATFAAPVASGRIVIGGFDETRAARASEDLQQVATLPVYVAHDLYTWRHDCG